jgi:hypothetical protein
LATDSTSGNDEHDVCLFQTLAINLSHVLQRMAQVVCDLLELSEAEKLEVAYFLVLLQQ